jgi:energy-coupling factor transport system permease protein
VIATVYRRRASALHAARAGVGASYCIVLAGLAVAFNNPLVLAALLATMIVVAASARVPEVVPAALRLGLPLGLVFALLNPLVSQNGLTVVARLGDIAPFGEIDVTLEALAYGGVIALQIIVVILAARLASAVVDPDELLRAFRRVSFHSALTAALATRMVGVLAADAHRLAEAQRCRPDGGQSGVRGRLAIVTAVVGGALDRSVDVAATLETRGYGSVRRAPRANSPWSRHDIAFTAAAAALVLLGVAAKLWRWAPFDAYPTTRLQIGPSLVVVCVAIAAISLCGFLNRRGIDR